MKRLLYTFALLLLLAGAPALVAAQSKKAEKTQAKVEAKAEPKAETKAEAAPAEEAPAEGGEVAGEGAEDAAAVSPLGGADMGNQLGFDFDLMEANRMSYDPSGAVLMEGRVVIRSESMNIDCDRLTTVKGSKTMVATGGPVLLSQGDAVKAECQKLTYDTETKKARLEGSPVIHQKDKDGNVTTFKGDIINIYQNAAGETGFSMESLGGRTSIVKNAGSKSKSTAAKGKPKTAAKVNGGNDLSLIKAPAIE